jgi:hypothetical protein
LAVRNFGLCCAVATKSIHPIEIPFIFVERLPFQSADLTRYDACLRASGRAMRQRDSVKEIAGSTTQLVVKRPASGLPVIERSGAMSPFGGKADIDLKTAQLLTQSGH